MQRLRKRGIQEERLELLDRCEQAENHLSMYGRMDVAPDPIPWRRTTSADAPWMGYLLSVSKVKEW